MNVVFPASYTPPAPWLWCYFRIKNLVSLTTKIMAGRGSRGAIIEALLAQKRRPGEQAVIEAVESQVGKHVINIQSSRFYCLRNSLVNEIHGFLSLCHANKLSIIWDFSQEPIASHWHSIWMLSLSCLHVLLVLLSKVFGQFILMMPN